MDLTSYADRLERWLEHSTGEHEGVYNDASGKSGAFKPAGLARLDPTSYWLARIYSHMAEPGTVRAAILRQAVTDLQYCYAIRQDSASSRSRGLEAFLGDLRWLTCETCAALRQEQPDGPSEEPRKALERAIMTLTLEPSGRIDCSIPKRMELFSTRVSIASCALLRAASTIRNG